MYSHGHEQIVNHKKKYSRKLSVFGGAGIVEGSTPQGEWKEISHKQAVMSSIFSSAPILVNHFIRNSHTNAWGSYKLG